MTRRIQVSVADLRRRLGERKNVGIDVLLPSLEVIASRSVESEAITGEVIIESIERGVSVLGGVEFAWVGECRRCLDVVDGRSDVTIDEIYQVNAPVDADLVELVDDQIDLLPLVRDAVLVGLPLAPLCREDCSGPDPDRYPTLTAEQVEAERAGQEPITDPRWSALAELDLTDD